MQTKVCKHTRVRNTEEKQALFQRKIEDIKP